MTYTFFCVFAYISGSVPFGLVIGRLKGIDLRHEGSKNIGATNVFRVIGKKWGLLVFILDAAKGYLAVKFPAFFGFHFPLSLLLLLGILAILGHSFPVWLKFRGGKGVATSLGVFLAIALLPTLFTFAIWILVFALSRIISLASLAAAAIFPVVIYFSRRDTSDIHWLFPISVCLAVFIFFTHRANIRRLARREEKHLI